MLQALDTRSPARFAGHGGVERGLHDQRGMRARMLVTNVPQAWTKAHLSWHVALTEPTQHPQRGREEGQQALGPMLLHVPTGLRLRRMLAARVDVALHRRIAPGEVRLQSAPRWHGEVNGFVSRLDDAITGRLDAHRPWRLTRAITAGRFFSSWPGPGSRCWRRPRSRASTSYVSMAEHMQRARLRLPMGSPGLLGAVPQARLLHGVGEPHEPGLLGPENFAD